MFLIDEGYQKIGKIDLFNFLVQEVNIYVN